MNPNQYQKTLIDIILNYLQDEDHGLPPGYFLAFYYGDPLDIPISLLPCVSVEKLSTAVKAGPTGMDEIDTLVAIKLMYNKRDDFGKTANEVLGVRALEQYAEGVDPATAQFDTATVMGILRKYFTLSTEENGYTILDQLVDINYIVTPRPKGTLTAEAQIKIRFHQLRQQTRDATPLV